MVHRLLELLRDLQDLMDDSQYEISGKLELNISEKIYHELFKIDATNYRTKGEIWEDKCLEEGSLPTYRRALKVNVNINK